MSFIVSNIDICPRFVADRGGGGHGNGDRRSCTALGQSLSVSTSLCIYIYSYVVKYRRADLRPVLIIRIHVGCFSIEFFDKSGCTPTIYKHWDIGYAVHNEFPYKMKTTGRSLLRDHR